MPSHPFLLQPLANITEVVFTGDSELPWKALEAYVVLTLLRKSVLKCSTMSDCAGGERRCMWRRGTCAASGWRAKPVPS